jgi:uncharacterized protein YgiM (DUF1202 family)
MQARVLDASTPVYENPDSLLASIAELHEGDELTIVKTESGNKWVQITLADNRTGYIAGATKIYRIKTVSLLQDAPVRAEANGSAAIETTLYKGNTLQLIGTVDGPDQKWVKIRYNNGLTGFILPETKIKEQTINSQYGRYGSRSGKSNMILGGVICIIGIVVTVGTYSAASSGGGSYYVAWGAIVFGGYRFVTGIIQVSRGH